MYMQHTYIYICSKNFQDNQFSDVFIYRNFSSHMSYKTPQEKKKKFIRIWKGGYVRLGFF